MRIKDLGWDLWDPIKEFYNYNQKLVSLACMRWYLHWHPSHFS